MMFKILLVLMIASSIHCQKQDKEFFLKCELEWFGRDMYCFLNNKEIITMDMLNVTKFRFSDNKVLTDLDKQDSEKIRAIVFKTSQIAFVPEEAFRKFRHLSMIGMTGTDLKVVDHKFLSNFLKFQHTHYMYMIDFSNNLIEKIDPEALTLLQYNRVMDFRNNSCINQVYTENSSYYELMRFDRCFYNFYQPVLSPATTNAPDFFMIFIGILLVYIYGI